MKRNLQVRFWTETTLAVISSALLVLSIIWPTWIEDTLGLEPDGGDGSTEWGWALAFSVATVMCVVSARRTWTRSLASD